ncbi:hypothetical protein V6N13_068880 [Hibiscus sabdariffa]
MPVTPPQPQPQPQSPRSSVLPLYRGTTAGHDSFVTPIFASSENSRSPRPSYRKPKAVQPSEPVKEEVRRSEEANMYLVCPEVPDEKTDSELRDLYPKLQKAFYKYDEELMILIIREALQNGEAIIGRFTLKSKLLDSEYVSEKLIETRVMKVKKVDEERYFEMVEDDGEDEEKKDDENDEKKDDEKKDNDEDDEDDEKKDDEDDEKKE